MFRVGFEPTISVLERAKTVHALDVIGICFRLHIFLILKTHQTDIPVNFRDFLSFGTGELYSHGRIAL
jgi:hypothetical protein